MYTKESEEHQFSFTHDWFVVPEVDENHELIKIARAIDWVSVSKKLSRFYCIDNGRPAKPSRANSCLPKNVYFLLIFRGFPTISLWRS